LSTLWFIAITFGWTQFYQYRGKQRERAQLMEKWRQTFESLQKRPAHGTKSVADGHRLFAHVEKLSFPRFSEAARKRARGYISHRLLELGYTPAQRAFSGGINLWTERPGQDPKSGVIVVGAHYDTVADSPGADDNASGVAAVLELAALFAKTPTPHTLRFLFFDGEERGCLGSRAYVANQYNRQGVQAAFILEMVGHTCTEPRCQSWPKGLPKWSHRNDGAFLAAVGDDRSLGLLKALTQSAGQGPPWVHPLPIPNRGRHFPDARRSDHAAFWDAGIAAVMLTDTANFRNHHYHQRTDRPMTIDRAFLKGTVDIVYGAILHLGEKTSPRPTVIQPAVPNSSPSK